jgi:hypothetical protein
LRASTSTACSTRTKAGAGRITSRRGARDFLDALRARGFDVVVFTTRWPDDVWRWLREHGMAECVVEVTDRKPAAHVFIDDRAVCFRGDFDATLREVDAFAAHWERGSGSLEREGFSRLLKNSDRHVDPRVLGCRHHSD